jgi:hypothetical protein
VWVRPMVDIIIVAVITWTLLIAGAVIICRAAAKETPVPEAVEEEQKVGQSKASSH